MTESKITPPPELVQQWLSEFYGSPTAPGESTLHVANRAGQWYADQELEACCKWLESEPDPGHVDLLRSCATALRDARRPKPQSLNSVALEMLSTIEKMDVVIPEITDTIRRALEALPDD